MFDRKVFHDGKENLYHFFKGGQHYKLVPMLEKNMDSNNNKVMENINNKVMNKKTTQIYMAMTEESCCVLLNNF
jgi:hypothetical protein